MFNKGIKSVEFDVEELEKWGKKSAFGKLSKYANPKLIPLEDSAWESAVTEKYGKILIDTNVILRYILNEVEGIEVFSFDKKLNNKLSIKNKDVDFVEDQS